VSLKKGLLCKESKALTVQKSVSGIKTEPSDAFMFRFTVKLQSLLEELTFNFLESRANYCITDEANSFEKLFQEFFLYFIT
jgi:hypothetical protein